MTPGPVVLGWVVHHRSPDGLTWHRGWIRHATRELAEREAESAVFHARVVRIVRANVVPA